VASNSHCVAGNSHLLELLEANVEAVEVSLHLHKRRRDHVQLPLGLTGGQEGSEGVALGGGQSTSTNDDTFNVQLLFDLFYSIVRSFFILIYFYFILFYFSLV